MSMGKPPRTVPTIVFLGVGSWWSKRGLPHQPQPNHSIDAKFSNSLVRPVYLLSSSGSLGCGVMAETDATDGSSRGVGNCRTPNGIPKPIRNSQLQQAGQLVPCSDFWDYSLAEAGATFVA